MNWAKNTAVAVEKAQQFLTYVCNNCMGGYQYYLIARRFLSLSLHEVTCVLGGSKLAVM